MSRICDITTSLFNLQCVQSVEIYCAQTLRMDLTVRWETPCVQQLNSEMHLHIYRLGNS